MFRLAEGPFVEDKELKDLATFCLTKTIEHQLANYFEAGWKNEPAETLYQKVKTRRIVTLVPPHVYLELWELGVDPATFLKKKVAQMMLQLQSEEEITFDLFNEYLLAKMIEKRSSRGLSGIAPTVQTRLATLKEKVHSYVDETMREELEEWGGDIELYEEEIVMFLTQFSSLLDQGEEKTEGYVFWDYDYTFIEEWGLKNVLSQCLYNPLILNYGDNYDQIIFGSVGETCNTSKIPVLDASALLNAQLWDFNVSLRDE